MRRFLAVCLVMLPLLQAPAYGAAARFTAPVAGPVVEHFKLKANPYAAGSHRGIDYGVAAGTPVTASGDGVVGFAGRVAGGLFVTVRHRGGLETTYSYLSSVDTVAGREVKQGEMIGLSGGGHPGRGSPALHFGAKANGRYIDPETLLFRPEEVADLIRMAPVRQDFRDG